MSLLAYLYQFKASLYRFFQLKRSVLAKQQKTKYAREVSVDEKKNLKLRCKKAEQEVQYLGRFSHWPIAKAKKAIERNSLIYLDVSRSKRTAFKYENRGDEQVISVISKTDLSKKRVKKLP
ncbi:MAG: hypothetical protein MJK15_19665 [Colwellia sp.]|nr:hypothetical protein [Colwellia sp.]